MEQHIPYGFCHCGCGGKTSIAKGTSSRRGIFKGKPVRFIAGHRSRLQKRTVTDEQKRENARQATNRWRYREKMRAIVVPGYSLEVEAKKKRHVETGKRWQKKNRERSRAIGLAYYYRNQDEQQAQSREYHRKNRDRVAELALAYQRANRELLRERNASRRALRLDALVTGSSVETALVVSEAGAVVTQIAVSHKELRGDWVGVSRNDPCPYVRGCAPVEHIDHIVPLINGGQHVWHNLVGASAAANHRKNSRSLLTFLLNERSS